MVLGRGRCRVLGAVADTQLGTRRPLAGNRAGAGGLSGPGPARGCGRRRASDRSIAGRAGVGGVYGTWQRLKALVKGEKHVPDHLAERP